TVRVVARETPSGVARAVQPACSATSVTAMPNTTLLMKPFRTSLMTSTPSCICDQNAPGSMPMSSTPTTQPPMTPTMEKTAASTGMAMTPPQKRGTSTLRMGSTAITSMAVSYSPALLSPLSAVIYVPARPASSLTVHHGHTL